MFITGVVDTGDKLFTGVVDTGDKLNGWLPALGWKRGRLTAAWKWVERELVDEAEGEGEAAGAHRRISPITAASGPASQLLSI